MLSHSFSQETPDCQFHKYFIFSCLFPQKIFFKSSAQAIKAHHSAFLLPYKLSLISPVFDMESAFSCAWCSIVQKINLPSFSRLVERQSSNWAEWEEEPGVYLVFKETPPTFSCRCQKYLVLLIPEPFKSYGAKQIVTWLFSLRV